MPRILSVDKITSPVWLCDRGRRLIEVLGLATQTTDGLRNLRHTRRDELAISMRKHRSIFSELIEAQDLESRSSGRTKVPAMLIEDEKSERARLDTIKAELERLHALMEEASHARNLAELQVKGFCSVVPDGALIVAQAEGREPPPIDLRGRASLRREF